METNPEAASFFPPRAPDDRSTHLHRQLIGYLGMALPVSVWLLAGIRSSTEAQPWTPLPSVSAYYYTGAVAVFSGILAALAVFLFTYRGYDNAFGRRDRWAAVIAGLAAMLVALFPTEAPSEGMKLSWWVPAHGILHSVAASVLFLDFAYFSLRLFPKSGPQAPAPSPSKKARNRIYIACGLAMLACIAWAGIAKIKSAPIFLPEALALEFFAVSWLAKGRAAWTAAALFRRIVSRKPPADVR